MWVIFTLVDPGPDCESGSGYGSRDLIKSGYGSTALVATGGQRHRFSSGRISGKLDGSAICNKTKREVKGLFVIGAGFQFPLKAQETA